MSQPPAYSPTTDFSQEADSGTVPANNIDASKLDAEFNNLNTTIDAILVNLASSQADDGSPKDDWVDLPALADDVINFITTNGNGWYGVDTGSVNAISVTLSPAPTAFVDGTFVFAKMVATNTSADVTLANTALGAKAVVTDGAGAKPGIGDLLIDTIYGFQYNSTLDKYQIVASTASISTSLAAALAAQTAAETAQTAAELAETNAAADAVSTAADAVSTAADAVSTAADVVSTAASAAAALVSKNAAAASAASIAIDFSAASDPLVTSDSANGDGNGLFSINSKWTNTSSKDVFVCKDASSGAAVWKKIHTEGQAINTERATVPSHATTSAIWAALGNEINFTGNETLTNLPAAPHAGASRILHIAGACTFANNANLIVQGAADYTCVAGDVVAVHAKTTAVFLIFITKGDGTSVVGSSGGSRNDIINGALTVNQENNTTPADDDYTAGDLFNHVGEGTPTISVETSGGPQGDRNWHKIICDVNAQAGLVYFLSNDEVQDFIANGKLSFGVQLKTTTAKLITNARIGILKWNSTADVITSDVVGTWASDGTDPTLATNWSYENTPADLALTASWQRFTVEDITVDSDTNNIGIFIWTDDGTITANDELCISEWQLNPGATVNDFSEDVELTAYKVDKYLQRWDYPSYNGIHGFGVVVGTALVDFMLPFRRKMAGVPAITESTASLFQVADGSAINAISAMADDVVEDHYLKYRATTTGMTIGNACKVFNAGATDTFIMADDRL